VRVLFVTHRYPSDREDTSGVVVHRLAVSLRAAGVEVEVLAPATEVMPTTGVLEDVPVHRFRFAPKPLERAIGARGFFDETLGTFRGKGAIAAILLAGGPALRRELARFAPDAVHAHWWFPSGVLAMYGVEDRPFVTSLHGPDSSVARRSPFAARMARRVLASSAAVVTSWDFVAGEARGYAPDVRFESIPAAIDPQFFRAEIAARVPGRFVFVGRLREGSGMPTLLEALAWSPRDTSLDVIGDGPQRAAFESSVERLGLRDRVRFLGALPRERLPQAYATAQALVAPGTGISQAVVAVEAQLCRTPVIAAMASALPDVVSAAWGGALVPRGDVRALADAITQLHAQAGMVDGRGAAARAHTLDRFSPSVVAARHLQLYRDITTRG